MKALDSKTTIQCNKVMHSEDSMIMCGIYNVETLEKLMNTVHHIHNFTSPNENFCRTARHNTTLTHIC